MKRNNYIDLLKAISVLFVLLYHLGLCDAGFLAVCAFFTISGYLFSNTINNPIFDIKTYYKKRLKMLYIPLVIVVLMTVFFFRYVFNIPWVTIKQETQSTLLGYHNFFQIESNSNYFLRADASPFTNMWYISILIQIEFLLPLINHFIKKTKYKRVFLYLATIISIIIFITYDIVYGIEVSYYHTLSRIFSFFIGCISYYLNIYSFNKKYPIILLSIIIASFIIGKNIQNYYVPLMIIDSLLCGLFIILSKNIDIKENKYIKYICDISYPIYLLQYPIIYIFNELSTLNKYFNYLIETIIIILLSILINYIKDINKNSILRKKFITAIISLTTILGLIGYLTCPNYIKEMEELEKELAISEKELLEKQNEYLEKLKSQKKDLENNLGSIDNAIENIDETVRNTQLAFIGDSVMLGGSYHMDDYFNNYYCDAKGSRGGYLGSDVLKEMLEKGVVQDYLIIHLGTNWGLYLDEVEEINAMLDNQKVFWLTVTNGWRKNENPMLKEYCDTHENNYLLDWYSYSINKKEYYTPDGVHLSTEGRKAYDQFIFDGIKPIIKEDLENKKLQLEQSYQEEIKNKISLYGNDILLSIYDSFDSSYIFNLDSNHSFETLYNQIKTDKENNTLSNTVLIVLDKSIRLKENQLNELNELLNEVNYHILGYGIKETQTQINLSNIFTKSQVALDGIHLNDEGKQLLIETIKGVTSK